MQSCHFEACIRPLAELVTLFALASGSYAQSVRLNGPLAQPGAADVTAYLIDASGQRVVYRADQNADEVYELFSAPADGSGPAVRLNEPLPSGGDVSGSASSESDIVLGADGRVVYTADQNTDDVFELFSVPIDGSASPVPLSGALVAGGSVRRFDLAPDGTRAVFLADKLVAGRSELFAVPIDGSAAPVQLDPQGRISIGSWIAPDGSFVLFTTAMPDGTKVLHRVPIDASQAPISIADSGPPPAGSVIGIPDVQIAPDGQHAAYLTVLGLDDDPELFAVGLDGSEAPVHLDSPIYSHFELAGERVVYHTGPGLRSIRLDGSDRKLLGGASAFVIAPDASQVVDLYSSPVDGSQPPIQLTAQNPLDGAISLDFQVGPNSGLVLYLAADWSTSSVGLWSVPIAGGQAPVLLSGPPIELSAVTSFAFAPDGQRAFYCASREQYTVFELYSIDDSLSPVKLSGPLHVVSDVASFQVSANSQRVVYLADAIDDETYEIFGAPSDGSAPAVRCNEPMPGGPVEGDVLAFRTTPDAASVVYVADELSNDWMDLFAVGLEAPGESLHLTGSLHVDVLPSFALAPAGDRVFFQFPYLEGYSLFSAPFAGTEESVEIDASTEAFPLPIAFTPDGSRAVYRRHSDDSGFGSGAYDLCSASLEGGAVVTLAAPQDLRSVVEFQLSPDGSTAVYRADQAHSTVIELYRVPVDGSAAPLRLNSVLSGERDVDAFAITPDGTRVVYLADQALDNRVELWSVPLAGGQRPDRLNGLLSSTGDVTDFQISADGAWVVFRADPEVDGRFELFRARAAGRRPPAVGPQGPLTGDLVRLTPLANGRSVQRDFVIGPDGGVFFRADAATDEVVELFRVSLDGSVPPLKLSADPVAGGDVTAFAVAPDGSHVVYVADARVDGVLELFGAPALGGSSVAYDTLPAFADVISFQIAPDSAHVGWLVDRNADTVPELFLAPLDGGAPARRVNDPLPPGGAVQETYALLSGGRAVYRADQESDEVFELFLGSFGPEARAVELAAARGARRR